MSTVGTANMWELQTVLLFNSLLLAVVISSFSQFIKRRHYLNISAKEKGKEPPRSWALKGQMTKDRKPKGHQRFKVWSEWSTLTTRLVWDTISGRKSLLGQERPETRETRETRRTQGHLVGRTGSLRHRWIRSCAEINHWLSDWLKTPMIYIFLGFLK